MMQSFRISLAPEVAQFYEHIALQAHQSTEQVLSDALFKLAGELSLHALHHAARS